MAQESHTMTVNGTGYSSKQVTVPADVQREEGICIDDDVEVAIHGVSDIIDRASFVGTQTGGDRVTIPADVVRQLGLVAGDEYDFTFEKVEGQESLPGAIPDEDVTDDEEVEEAIESAESESNDDSPGLGELFSTDDEEEVEAEDEQEEEGLGELFG